MEHLKQMAIALFVFPFIPLKGYSQTTGIYTGSDGIKYAAIHSKGLPESRIEDRNENAAFYTTVQLYRYVDTTEKTTEAVTDADGNTVSVKRVVRHSEHINSGPYNQKVSEYFIVSPDIVNSDGQKGVELMHWATANGYLNSANSNAYNVAAVAVPKGCAMYRGKNGTDEPGTWRVPTFREGSLIMIFYKELEAIQTETGFEKFSQSTKDGTTYWLATEFNGSYSQAWYMTIWPDDMKVKYKSGTVAKSTKYYLRCIRDVSPK